MALRAGYYGIKKSVARILEKLASDMAGAVIIKSVGDGLSISEEGVLSSDGISLTSTEKKVGKIGNVDLYEKTFTFKSTDLQDATISASVIKGAFILDVHAFDRIWIDYGNSYYYNGASTPAPKSLALNYYAGDGTKYTRTNLQQRSTSYEGKPFVYFDSTYAESVYDNVTDLEWLFTVKYTKATASVNTKKATVKKGR